MDKIHILSLWRFPVSLTIRNWPLILPNILYTLKSLWSEKLDLACNNKCEINICHKQCICRQDILLIVIPLFIVYDSYESSHTKVNLAFTGCFATVPLKESMKNLFSIYSSYWLFWIYYFCCFIILVLPKYLSYTFLRKPKRVVLIVMRMKYIIYINFPICFLRWFSNSLPRNVINIWFSPGLDQMVSYIYHFYGLFQISNLCIRTNYFDFYWFLIWLSILL